MAGGLKPGLLVASPQMKDQWFENAVVLICHHDEDRALGLVINRDGPVSLGTVVEQMGIDPPAGQDPQTWWGGPVGPGTGFVIWRGKGDPEEGWNLEQDVAVSPSAERLERLCQSGQRFHLCLGYAGWGPGQLDEEIESGSWLYVDLDAEIIFDTPLMARYRSALANLGLTPEMVWMKPIDE